MMLTSSNSNFGSIFQLTFLFWVKYVFVPQVSINFGISTSSKYQFSPSFLKMCEFNSYYQILLSLSNVSSAFHDSI